MSTIEGGGGRTGTVEAAGPVRPAKVSRLTRIRFLTQSEMVCCTKQYKVPGHFRNHVVNWHGINSAYQLGLVTANGSYIPLKKRVG